MAVIAALWSVVWWTVGVFLLTLLPQSGG